MHIVEGALSGAAGTLVLAGGAAITAAGTAVGLYRLDERQIPRVALLSAAFFVASLVPVPVGPVAVHLVLNGLLGLILGWAAFPALLVALALQAAFFQYGGLTTLGVNTATMALPAVAAHYVFRRGVRWGRPRLAAVCGFAAAAAALLGSALLVAAALVIAGSEYRAVAATVVAANLPVAVVEGLVATAAVGFLAKVRPEVLSNAGWSVAAEAGRG